LHRPLHDAGIRHIFGVPGDLQPGFHAAIGRPGRPGLDWRLQRAQRLIADKFLLIAKRHARGTRASAHHPRDSFRSLTDSLGSAMSPLSGMGAWGPKRPLAFRGRQSVERRETTVARTMQNGNVFRCRHEHACRNSIRFCKIGRMPTRSRSDLP
jgi:hypothetical protein